MTSLPLTPTMPLRIDADGVVRVGRTRVTLDTIICAFREGCTAEGIAEQYPSTELADVYATIAYYLRDRAAVEAYLTERGTLAREVRRENETRWTPFGLRERLLARRRPPNA